MMMSKPSSSSSSSSSSPLKNLKVKSPKNIFAKKNKNKENADNSTAKSVTNGSTKSDDVTSSNGEREQEDTPTLSNTAKKLNKNNNGSEFPTLPDLMGDEGDNDHIDNNNDDDDESVAAMSDIHDNHSLNDSYVSDDDYYKQDYYNMGVDVDTSIAEGETDGSKKDGDSKEEQTTNNITMNEVATKDYDGNGDNAAEHHPPHHEGTTRASLLRSKQQRPTIICPNHRDNPHLPTRLDQGCHFTTMKLVSMLPISKHHHISLELMYLQQQLQIVLPMKALLTYPHQ